MTSASFAPGPQRGPLSAGGEWLHLESDPAMTRPAMRHPKGLDAGLSPEGFNFGFNVAFVSLSPTGWLFKLFSGLASYLHSTCLAKLKISHLLVV